MTVTIRNNKIYNQFDEEIGDVIAKDLTNEEKQYLVKTYNLRIDCYNDIRNYVCSEKRFIELIKDTYKFLYIRDINGNSGLNFNEYQLNGAFKKIGDNMIKLEIKDRNLFNITIENKNKLLKSINDKLNTIFKTRSVEYLRFDDVDSLYRIGYSYLEKDQEHISTLISKYGFNSDYINEILSNYVLVIHKKHGIIDHGEYSINGFLNPYLKNKNIAFIDMDMLAKYL